MKGAAATGVAATGITAFSGSAAAQEAPNWTVNIPDEEEDYSFPAEEDSTATIERGNPNAVLEELDITITDVDEEAQTLSGTVTGIVLPNENANRNAAREVDTSFEDVPFSGQVLEESDNPSQLILLVIEDLFLDVLGLQVTLDLVLDVVADPEGGLLGQLLAGLGREL